MAKAVQQNQSTAVATLAPRLAFDPVVAQKFGISNSGWLTLVDAIFPLAQSAAGVALALSYCKVRKLDPFKRVCHIVPIWNAKLNRNIETVWPGIAELRMTAFRTGVYAGCDPTEFGPVRKFTLEGKESNYENGSKVERKRTAIVEAPEWCRITVWRIVAGTRVSFPGPTVYFLASYGKKSRASDLPTEKWERTAAYMLEKVAEAAALRKAFPEEIGDWSSSDEAEAGLDLSDEAEAGIDLSGGPVIDNWETAPSDAPEAETSKPKAETKKADAKKAEEKKPATIDLVDGDGVVVASLPAMSAWVAALGDLVKDREPVDAEAIYSANRATLETISTRAANSGAAELVEACRLIAETFLPPVDDAGGSENAS